MSSYNRYQDILATAMLALEAVGNLDPPSDDAPAPVRQTFVENLIQIHQVVGQATDLLVGISTTAERDIDLEKAAGPWSASEIIENLSVPAQEEEDPGNPKDPILRRHLEEIFDITSSASLDDLVSVVLRGYPGSLVEQDKTALRYCLSGYKNFPKRELKVAFHFYDRRLKLTDMAKRAIELNRIDDETERLVARESLLFTGPDSNHATSFILKVIWNIESIEAMRVWDTLSVQEKNEFRCKMAPLAYSDAFDKIEKDNGLSDEEKKDAKDSLVQKFTGRQNKIMQRRRYFLDLYQNCGPCVLLDSYLLALTQSEYPVGSRFLDKLMNGVLARIHEFNWGREKYWQNRRIFLRVVRFLGGYRMFTYVNDFLDNNIPWDDLDSDIGEDSDSDWGDESDWEE